MCSVIVSVTHMCFIFMKIINWHTYSRIRYRLCWKIHNLAQNQIIQTISLEGKIIWKLVSNILSFKFCKIQAIYHSKVASLSICEKNLHVILDFRGLLEYQEITCPKFHGRPHQVREVHIRPVSFSTYSLRSSSVLTYTVSSTNNCAEL